MPISKIQQTIEQQRAALLRGDVATLARYASQWQQVQQALADKAELLAHELAQMEADGETISEAKLYQLARYQAFVQQARAEIDRYAQQLAPDVSQQQQKLAQQGTQDAVAQIAAITGSFLQLPSAATNVAIGYAADGSPLVNLLRATWPDAVASMTQALVHGVAAGYSPRKTARQMQEASGASLNRMLTVARTETLRAYRESSRDIYQKAGVKQYKRLAAKNARTCFLCLADDGHIYQVSEPLPVHPNCRCSSVPLVDGYKVDTGQTGAEWFAQQDTETQKQILGASRFAQYQQGTPLARFAGVVHDDTWGATLRARGANDIQTQPRINHGAVLREKLAGVLDALHGGVQPLREKLATLNEQADAAWASGEYERAEKIVSQIDKTWKQIKKATNNDAYTKAIREIVYQDANTSLNVRQGNFQKPARQSDVAEWDKGIEAFKRLIGNTYSIKEMVYVVGTGNAGRAYAQGNAVVMYKGDGARVVVHELGHILETNNPDVHQHAMQFLNRRTEGETPIPLRTYAQAYGADEYTTPDRFTNPYVGKRYSHTGASEVISMGLEYLYADPAEFAKTDPDYFDFIVNLVRGGL